MSKLVLLSKDVIWNKQTRTPYDGVYNILNDLRQNNKLLLISNHDKPSWLPANFPFVDFYKCGTRPPRQSGKCVLDIISDRKINHSDIVVLGAIDTDLQMAVNSKTILFHCKWGEALHERTNSYGIPINDPSIIPLAFSLIESENPWYFRYLSSQLDIYSLTNAGTYKETDQQALRLVKRLKECLKVGNRRDYLNAFKLHFLSSAYTNQEIRQADFWGYYPSSDSTNQQEEIMYQFVDIARKTFKKPVLPPMIIRHKQATQRHKDYTSTNKLNPKYQLETVHLNEFYKSKLLNKTVVILDDYTTYGTSFGVAHALLKKAGVSKVICIAIGKFGSQTHLYNINIETNNVYAPINSAEIVYNSNLLTTGVTSQEAHYDFLKKFKNRVK